jgi:hypothetical protein
MAAGLQPLLPFMTEEFGSLGVKEFASFGPQLIKSQSPTLLIFKCGPRKRIRGPDRLNRRLSA